MFWTLPDPRRILGAQGLTTLLFPLSVIKTRQMALEGAPTGLRVGHRPPQSALSAPSSAMARGVQGLGRVVEYLRAVTRKVTGACVGEAPGDTSAVTKH